MEHVHLAIEKEVLELASFMLADRSSFLFLFPECLDKVFLIIRVVGVGYRQSLELKFRSISVCSARSQLV